MRVDWLQAQSEVKNASCPQSQLRELQVLSDTASPTSTNDAPRHDESAQKDDLRAWLRLFAATTLIENEIRSRLREKFNFTLPRFDMLSQLDRCPEGLVLGEISRRLMVTAGNITAICEKLIDDGYVARTASKSDRRVQIVRMTHAGRAAFGAMATAHAAWINDFFGDLSAAEIESLNRILPKLKTSVQARSCKPYPAGPEIA